MDIAENINKKLPRIPLLVFGVVCVVTLLYLSGPSIGKMLGVGGANNVRQIWFGYVLHNKCLVTVCVVNPESEPGKVLARKHDPNHLLVGLTIDNRKGVSAVRLCSTGARFYTFNSRSIAAVGAGEELEQLMGKGPSSIFVSFKKQEIMSEITRLYAFQFMLDGKPVNLQGRYYASPKEAADRLKKLQRRIGVPAD